MHKWLILGGALFLANCDSPAPEPEHGPSNETVGGMAGPTSPSRGAEEAHVETDATVGALAVSDTNETHAYVSTVSVNSLYAREASELALSRSRSQAVQNFARDVIAQQKIRMGALQTATVGTNPAISPAMAVDTRRSAMLVNLRDAEDFDQLYLDQQGQTLSEELALHQAQARAGEHEPLRKMAAESAAENERMLARLEVVATERAKEPR